MIQERVPVWKWTGLALSIASLVISLFKHTKYSKRLKTIQNAEMIGKNDLNKQKQKEICLVKYYSTSKGVYKKRNQVGFNQSLANIYPIREYINKMAKELNRKERSFKYFGVQKIINQDVFDQKHVYQSIFDGPNPPGFFKHAYIVLGSTVAFFLQFVFQVVFSGRAQTSIYIQGPTVGHIDSQISLVKDRPLILQCQFKDNHWIYLALGLQKSDFLDYYSDKVDRYKKLIFLSSLALFYYRKDIKNIFDKLARYIDRMYTIRIMDDRFDPRVTEQQQTCIVCYNKCRSVILKRCKHLVLCDQCVFNQFHDVIDKCPLCRVDVDGEYVRIKNSEVQVQVRL